MHKFFYAWASFILGRKEFGMSLFIEIFLIGVGLSMDAFAVSICKGLSMKKIKKRDVFIIALFFELSSISIILSSIILCYKLYCIISL